MRKTFVFYSSWMESLDGFPDDVCLEVLKAIIHYASTGEVPGELSPLGRMAFQFVKPMIDENEKAFNEKSEKYKANAKKRWGEHAENNAMASTNMQSHNLHNEKCNGINGNATACKDDNCIDLHYENENENENENVSTTLRSVDKDKVSSSLRSEEDLRRRVETDNSEQPKDEDKNNADSAGSVRRGQQKAELCNDLREYFNEAVIREGSSIPVVKTMSCQRKDMLMARIREYGVDTIRHVFDKAAQSNFLGGDNSRGFKANFDWIIRPNNFPKILDGNYDNQPHQTRTYDNNRANASTKQQSADHIIGLAHQILANTDLSDM